MTAALFVAVLVVFAFVVGRVLDRFASRLLVLAGGEYVILGAVVAPWLERSMLTPDDAIALDLLISTVLGAVGLSVGLGIRHARAGRDAILAGFVAAAAVVVVVGVAMTEAIELLDPVLAAADPIVAEPIEVGTIVLWIWITPVALWVGLTVGAAAAGASSAVVEATLARFGVGAGRAGFLRGMASSAEIVAFFAFGTGMAASRATASAGVLGLTIIEWSLVTILAGALTGLLFVAFLGREDDEMRLNVATLGIVVFAAGVGVALGVSPLLVNLIAGLTVAWVYPRADRLDDAFGPLRAPIGVLVLVLAGVTWVPTTAWFWLLVPGYAALRLLARRVFSRIAVATFVGERAMAPGAGRALMTQGVVAAAISLAFAQRFPDMAAVVTSTILGGMLATNLISVRSLRRYLADMGEIHPLAGDPKEASP